MQVQLITRVFKVRYTRVDTSKHTHFTCFYWELACLQLRYYSLLASTLSCHRFFVPPTKSTCTRQYSIGFNIDSRCCSNGGSLESARPLTFNPRTLTFQLWSCCLCCCWLWYSCSNKQGRVESCTAAQTGYV